MSPPVTPFSQSPNIASQPQSPPIFESQTDPMEGKSSVNKGDSVGGQDSDAAPEGVFKEPSKPIDINRPSSSRSRAPPQRSDSETSSTHMEVDDASGSVDKQTVNTDIDSGFENMEVIYMSLTFFILLVTNGNRPIACSNYNIFHFQII